MTKLQILVVVLSFLPGAIAAGAEAPASPTTSGKPADEDALAEATFAGGCFWCMEAPFDEVAGVHSTTSGYTGGHRENPTYPEVSAGGTGHTEAVRIGYDPSRVTYAELLRIFWRNVDPLDAGGQFCDRGSQYRTGIFAHSEEQKRTATESKRELDASGALPGPIVTEIVEAGPFYPAEGYHQDYYRKNPVRYSLYRYGCGRDRRLREIWGDEAGGEHHKPPPG